MQEKHGGAGRNRTQNNPVFIVLHNLDPVNWLEILPIRRIPYNSAAEIVHVRWDISDTRPANTTC
jgi:hypothetical protein